MGYDVLFSPMNIGSMTVKNRIVMAAAEVSMAQTDGKPTERLMDYYEARAKGGVGLIIPGITRVNDMGGASTFTQLSMSHDYHIEPMRKFARRIHNHGSKLCIQLHHAGRQGYSSSINSLPLVIPIVRKIPKVLDGLYACTPLLLGLEAKGICMSVQAPSKCELAVHGAMRMHAMSNREVKKLIKDFVDAAYRAKLASVDAVELHAGHGYMIQQFLSPNTNHRTDEYGGSFENRMRFITEIIEGIREKCGKDFPLIVRITVDEMYERIGLKGKGYDLETGKLIAKRLEELGVDALNVTSACYEVYNGWLEPTTYEPGWRKYLAKEIKSVVSIPVIAANVIRTPEQAEQQLEEGYQDFIASARTFFCDPEWAKKAKEGRPEEIRRCIGCLHCMKTFMNNATIGKPTECALNMSFGREKEYENIPVNGDGRKVVIVGAGPAGLIAGQTLAKRGFDVEIFDKNEKAGGQVITAAKCNLRDKLYWSIEDLMTLVKKDGAKLTLGKEISADDIKQMNPYAVILATGGIPVVPKSIPGTDKENVYTADEIILKQKEISGSKVVVVGSGMTGLETAEILGEAGNKVTVIEMANEIAPGAWFQLVDDEMERLNPQGVEFMLNTKLVSIEEGRIVCEDAKSGEKKNIEAEHVVLSLGVRPTPGAAEEIEKLSGIKIYRVGDALSSGTIANACHSAFETALKIN